MKFCPTCAAQLNDSAAFCESCGTPVSRQEEPIAPPVRRPRGKNLHCPECGGNRLSPVVESTNNGGVAVSSPMTRRVGVTTYTSTTTHRNYWMCQDCGHKFRNLQNLKEEIAAESKRMKSCFICGIIFGVICLLFGPFAAGDQVVALFTLPVLIFLVIGDLLFWGIWLTTRNKVTKMMEEKRYLVSRCFDRS